MSRAFAVFLMLGAVMRAQTAADAFDKAPADVDDALKARITAFYQAHVDHKFRQADQYVAEDTKDFYYEANKPVYLSFRIDKIAYSDNFTKAKAVVTCKMHVTMLGMPDMVSEVPTPSTWKLEKGEWYWYVDQKAGRETPFGHWSPQGSSGGAMPSLAGAPDVQAVQKMVQVDRKSVELSATDPSSAEVAISSKIAVTLQVEALKTPGLEVSLDRTELAAGEQAKLKFHFEPPPGTTPKAVRVIVRAMPTNQAIPVTAVIK